MAYGDPVWTAYPWGNATGDYNVTYPIYTSSGSYTVQPTWYSSGTYYAAPPVPIEERITEKIESAMDWLRRRVTEVTDLAYAEV